MPKKGFARSTKILFWVLGIVLVSGIGAYFYISKYGTVGADTKSTASKQIYLKSSIPSDQEFNVAQRYKMVRLVFSAPITNKINQSEIRVTSKNADGREGNVIQTWVTVTNPNEIRLSFEEYGGFRPETLYTVEVNPLDDSIRPAKVSFSTFSTTQPILPIVSIYGNVATAKSASVGMYQFKLVDNNSKIVKKSSEMAIGYYPVEINSKANTAERTGERIQPVSYLTSSIPTGTYSAQFRITNSEGSTAWKKSSLNYYSPVTLSASVDSTNKAKFTSAPVTNPDGTIYAEKNINVVYTTYDDDTIAKKITTDKNGVFTLDSIDLKTGAWYLNISASISTSTASMPVVILDTRYAINWVVGL